MEKDMYNFIAVSSNGSTRDCGPARRTSIQEIFNTKRTDEAVFVVWNETGARYRVNRP